MEQLHCSKSIKVETACRSNTLWYSALTSVSVSLNHRMVSKWNRLVVKQKTNFNPVL